MTKKLAKSPKTSSNQDKNHSNLPSTNISNILGLYLVATPIGNLEDITVRALKILKKSTIIACEDRRVTSKLLKLLGIKTPLLLSYHDHNARQMGPLIIEKMLNGDMVSLVSDAGTPLLSDPGYLLVRECIEKNIPITIIPGPSAFLSALQLSGIPSENFYFSGFLPAKKKARLEILQSLSSLNTTLIFYEAPHRLIESLEDMNKVLGSRKASISREITKLFEETKREDLSSLTQYYNENGAPKGEIVIVIAPPHKKSEKINPDQLIAEFLETHSLKDSVQEVSAMTGLSKKEIYIKALSQSKDKKIAK